MLPRDDRWFDPHKTPLTNGPVRITTPPGQPHLSVTVAGAQIIEIFLPFPIYTVDINEWPPIRVQSDGFTLYIHKPAWLDQSQTPQGAFSNESPDLFTSVIRAEIAPGGASENPVPSGKLVPVFRELLKWIRALGRQFWIFGGAPGFGTWMRGALFLGANGRTGQQNFAHFGQNVMIKPLTIELWHGIEREMELGNRIPASDLLYCDALCCIPTGDQVRAVLELGVSAEVAVSSLLADRIIQLSPLDRNVLRYLKLQSQLRIRFAEKLTKWPQLFGLQSATTFTEPGMPQDWVELLLTLYRFRNSAAHSGQCSIWDAKTQAKRPLTRNELETFVFAVESLHHWVETVRATNGLQQYAYRWPSYAKRPVYAIVGEVEETHAFSVDTSWSWSPIVVTNETHNSS